MSIQLQSDKFIYHHISKNNNEVELCSQCGHVLKPVYENQGFNSPEPTHEELVGFRLCNHKHSDDNGE